MTDLDDKLREAIRYVANEDGYAEAKDLDVAVAQIKQAFADEGYGIGASHIYSDKGAEKLCMTGQEWYDRFEKLLDGQDSHTAHQILIYAKEAASLKEIEMPDTLNLRGTVFQALGEVSAVFMSQPIKGTEIVMPEKDLTRIGDKLVADIKKLVDPDPDGDIYHLAKEARIAELERLKQAHSINIFDEYVNNRIAELKGAKPN